MKEYGSRIKAMGWDMDYESIVIEREQNVALVSLNRPEKMNPLSTTMFAELKDVFSQLRCDSEIRAVVLTGEGKAFCSGGDVKELRSGNLVVDTVLEGRRSSKEFMLALQSFEKPLIGAINGLAAGGGAGLLLACDVVFASRAAAFSLIFRRIGMMPDCGTLYLLPRIVGPSKAKQLAFSGEIIDCEEMYRLGLVQEIVDGDARQRACEFAHECAEGPSRALGISKMLIDRAWGMNIESFFDYESLALPFVMQSEDFREGTAAFLEKRPVQFGRSAF